MPTGTLPPASARGLLGFPRRTAGPSPCAHSWVFCWQKPRQGARNIIPATGRAAAERERGAVRPVPVTLPGGRAGPSRAHRPAPAALGSCSAGEGPGDGAAAGAAAVRAQPRAGRAGEWASRGARAIWLPWDPQAVTQQPLNRGLSPSLPGEDPGQHTDLWHPWRGPGASPLERWEVVPTGPSLFELGLPATRNHRLPQPRLVPSPAGPLKPSY